MAALDLERDDGVLLAEAALVHVQGAVSQDQLWARLGWRLPGLADEWKPSWKLRLDAATGQVLEHGMGLAFQSRCRCLALGLEATWAEDRDGVGLSLELDAGYHP